jgi:hypothetical protein
MGLFGPGWKRRNAYKAIDAINLLNSEESQGIFESIVNNDARDEVRAAALCRVTNQDFVMRIFNDNTNDLIRVAAAQAMTSADSLKEIAIENKSAKVRDMAIYYLSTIDSEALKEVALSYSESASMVFYYLKDDDFALEILCNSSIRTSDEVKRAAFSSIKSQEKLCEAVLHCNHLGLAQQNVSRIVDQRLLMKIAITPYKISEKARALITDVSVLNEVKRIKEQKQDKANLSREEIDANADEGFYRENKRNCECSKYYNMH